jgi:hypothetical protein
MIITKIIPGFVSQRFDTEKQCWLDQEFVGGDSEIFDANGEELSTQLAEQLQRDYPVLSESSLPLLMVQPKSVDGVSLAG